MCVLIAVPDFLFLIDFCLQFSGVYEKVRVALFDDLSGSG